MIHGLTVGEFTVVVSILVAAGMILLGAVGTLWPRRAPSGDVLELELPHIKVKSNVVAIGIVIGGIGLLFGSFWAASRLTPQFPLTGRILLDDGRTISGISVGLIPPRHYAVTSANGTFRLDLPRPNSDESGAYQAVVYYRDRDHLQAEIAPVVIDQNWVATLEHRFGRQ